jgi:hypothetical protein
MFNIMVRRRWSLVGPPRYVLLTNLQYIVLKAGGSLLIIFWGLGWVAVVMWEFV